MSNFKSYLFVKGHTTEEHLEKALKTNADAVILDLEAVSYTHLTLPTNREV